MLADVRRANCGGRSLGTATLRSRGDGTRERARRRGSRRHINRDRVSRESPPSESGLTAGTSSPLAVGIDLPRRQVTLSRCPPQPSGASCPTVWVSPTITALTRDGDRLMWYVVDQVMREVRPGS